MKIAELSWSFFTAVRTNDTSKFPGCETSTANKITIATFGSCLLVRKETDLRVSATKRTLTIRHRRFSSSWPSAGFGQPLQIWLQRGFTEKLHIRWRVPILDQQFS